MNPEDFPRTLVEFDERFGSEEACQQYLFAGRWPEGFRCPVCRNPKAWLNKRHLLVCSACGRQVSLIAGTVMQGTRKPLRMWFRAIWWVCTQKTGGSAQGLQRLLGLGSYQTAWAWLHRLLSLAKTRSAWGRGGFGHCRTAGVGCGMGSIQRHHRPTTVSVEPRRSPRLHDDPASTWFSR